MPWAPELFTVPALQQLLDRRRQESLRSVPFFDGFFMGEPEAMVDSFAGEPELYHPLRGRIKGAHAFRAFIAEMSTWLVRHNVAVEDVERSILADGAFEEVVLHLDGDAGRVELPFAIVAGHTPDGGLSELRTYYSSWPLTGGHASRPPLLQPDAGVRLPDVVAAYQRAFAAGDADAIVAAFEPDGSVREPAGGPYVHRGPDAVRGFYDVMFSNGGGVPLEQCCVLDDGRACAVEYNVVRWGSTELRPQAGIVVHVRGESGALAAVRIYDDVDRPVAPR
jgi:hypothetical protein